MPRRQDVEREKARLTDGDRAAWRQLLVGLQSRDADAIALYIEWMRPRLVRRFEAKGVGAADAQCMTQDVLLGFVWRYADRIRHPQAMDAYLRLMCATRLRRLRRDQSRQVDLAGPLPAAPLDAALPEPGSGMDRRRLADCLDRLTARVRGRLQKHFHFGLGYAAIGRTEGCTGQAVRQSIVAGLSTLRACMEAET